MTATAPKKEIEYWVARNMMVANKKNINFSENDIENFIEKYKDTIDSVVKYMPRGMTTVGAAVAKCALKYDKNKALEFLKNFKDEIFAGKEDPVYHFYMWIHGVKGPKRKKHDISTFEITAYACKQYCIGKKIKRLDRIKDVFKWADNWVIQD
jgi:hypothetical protein